MKLKTHPLKLYILFAMMSIANIAYSQDVETKIIYQENVAVDTLEMYKGYILDMKTPGNEILKFQSDYSGGTLMQTLGVTACIIGIYTNQKNANDGNAWIILGGGLAAGGTILKLYSFKRLKKAGIMMNENGIGLHYNLTK